ncbi:MAG: SusC/RagA family TonB-linked outer membrane protein, partial [Leadbetterella sp.]
MNKIYFNWRGKFVFSFALLLWSCAAVIAQDGQVSGAVKDESGMALTGVSVSIKGSSRGTSTDAEGNFKINASPSSTLVFSFVGFESQDVVIGNKSILNITLRADAKLLEETVVIGYGTVKKRDVINSVGVAKAKDFGEVTVTNTQQLLQGKLAGVQVVNSNGLPGQSTKLFIRGTGTFTNADPLYVIDGIQGGDINSVAPQDIEDVTVMKDASSVAIYGAAAANGVVIVTTKKAKGGAPKVTYQIQHGVSTASSRYELLNSRQYVDLVTEMVAGKTEGSVIGTPKSLVDQTDWQDQIFQSAPQTNQYLNVSGGSTKTTYNMSLGYENQDGIFRPYNFQRVRFRVALEEKIGRVRLGQNINTTYNTYSGATYSLDQAIRMPPYAPVYDATVPGGYYNVRPTIDLQDA